MRWPLNKRCTKCGNTKELALYYRNRNCFDGRMSECIECKKIRDKEVRTRKSYIERRKVWTKKFKKTEKGRLSNLRYLKNSRERHPEKFKARSLVKVAKNNGTLIPRPCEVCGEKKVHAHHFDYKYPLIVKWLCVDHHNELHNYKGAYI